MKIGAHVSIAGGFHNVLDRVRDIGGNCGQVFVHSPQMWKKPDLDEDEAAAFKAAYEKSDLDPIVVHCGYLINLASHKRKGYYGSIDLLKAELQATAQLGLPGVVLHPGSHLGKGRDYGLQRVVKALNKLADVTPDTIIYVENMSGKGNILCDDFDDWRYIYENVERENVQFCFDTCHAFAAGHAIHTEDGLEETIEKVEDAVGWTNVPVIHLNDSKAPFGSNRDRHEHIGRGEIGDEAMRRTLDHKKLKDKAFVLETPVDENADHRDDIRHVKELMV